MRLAEFKSDLKLIHKTGRLTWVKERNLLKKSAKKSLKKIVNFDVKAAFLSSLFEAEKR